MAWTALNILRVVKSNPEKGKQLCCCIVFQVPVKDYVLHKGFSLGWLW